jgi:HdeA/HdeB family
MRRMRIRALDPIAATALLVSLVLPMSAEGQATDIPPRRVEIGAYLCGQFSGLTISEARDRILIYMNGYVDGSRKATHWDAEQAARRIDEVARICRDNPKLSLLEAFRRASRP